MDLASIEGTARAQRLARDVIHEVGATLRAGDREIDVANKIDEACTRAGVHRFLHTAYAWWGERTRFAKFVDWEPDALPTTRRLEEGECFIIDVAPIVSGYVADYALSGTLGKQARDETHHELLDALRDVKQKIVDFSKKQPTGGELMRRVGALVDQRGLDAIHPMYPGNVLGHTLEPFPNVFGRAAPIGKGFQLPLLGTYAFELVRHRLRGAPYPLINYEDRGEIRGLWAVEPHVARGDVGAKFESILVVDGDETRWLDPDLFGEVTS
jgi:Xaa-Pro aminopeptidase